MMKKVVILQSNYIPWKGYFDLINDADEFIFYDDVQYTRNDWRNRNVIKTAQGLHWLSVPVGSDRDRLVCDVEIKDHSWQIKHYKTLVANYGKSPFFEMYQPFLKELYIDTHWVKLSDLNQFIIKSVSNRFLGIDTVFRDSRELVATGKKQERLLEILRKVDARTYISGPAAKNYIESAGFEAEKIELVWKDYSGYPAYPQKYLQFEHGVSIFDLLFNVGPKAPWFIWGWRNDASHMP
ncbi:hypothetical protein KP729_001667|uniref:WbqC family protein n=1 Tax=Delftia acidovorans TaxID=80866 RepID=UPI001C0B572F|nr:WbqC family protein [Delftia acidovorans]MCA1068308.1 hypothetical protein [Delftia acidovorans]